MNFRKISSYTTAQTSDAVYVIGGYGTYDIVAEFKMNKWRRLDNLNQGRFEHCSITIEGQTMIAGGTPRNGSPRKWVFQIVS